MQANSTVLLSTAVGGGMLRTLPARQVWQSACRQLPLRWRGLPLLHRLWSVLQYLCREMCCRHSSGTRELPERLAWRQGLQRAGDRMLRLSRHHALSGQPGSVCATIQLRLIRCQQGGFCPHRQRDRCRLDAEDIIRFMADKFEDTIHKSLWVGMSYLNEKSAESQRSFFLLPLKDLNLRPPD